MASNKVFCLVLIFGLCCKLYAAQDTNAWEKLNLGSTRLAGATVYYEKCFEPNLPFFETAYKRFLAEQDKVRIVPFKQEQIIAEINEILGTTEPNAAIKVNFLEMMADSFFPPRPTFYLVRRATTKDYLRSGGQLPNYEYDEAADVATYRFEIKLTSENKPVEEVELSFPLGSEADFEREVSDIFSMFAKECIGTGMAGVAIHELVEMILFIQIKPRGVYWRWFTDGFANAIAYKILKKHAGAEIADRFIAACDVNDYKDLEKEINLLYWMSAKYCILPLGGPVEYENRFTLARYSYATLEAQRLIDKHGIKCIKKILDILDRMELSSCENLMSAIEEATGEDMRRRLSRYQTFATAKEGIPKYTYPFASASKRKDYEQMLVNLFRIMELQGSPYSSNNLQSWHNAALFLYKMGHEEVGDQVMYNCIELFEGSPIPQGREAAMEAFLLYALKCNNPRKAYEMAEELLRLKADDKVALTVRMLVSAESGKLEEAQQIARRIQNIERNKQSPFYQTASKVLAVDPNL